MLESRRQWERQDTKGKHYLIGEYVYVICVLHKLFVVGLFHSQQPLLTLVNLVLRVRKLLPFLIFPELYGAETNLCNWKGIESGRRSPAGKEKKKTLVQPKEMWKILVQAISALTNTWAKPPKRHLHALDSSIEAHQPEVNFPNTSSSKRAKKSHKIRTQTHRLRTV